MTRLRVFRALLLSCLLFSAAAGRAGDPLDSWQWRNPLPTGNNLFGIAFLNNNFVAVGEAGSVFTSSDGVSWTTKSTGLSNAVRNVTFGNGIYVAVGDSGAISSSPDLETWTRADSGIGTGIFATNLNAVTFANGVFVEVGD